MNENVEEMPLTSTSPCFLSETEKLCSELKLVTADEWEKKMKITNALAVNTQRHFLNWSKKKVLNGLPAALLFSGEAFKSFDAKTFTDTNWNEAQRVLRILSGFYGVLKPTDTVLPYRLMVGTPFKTKGGLTLYKYWSSLITESLKREIQEDGYLLNLASDEYFKLVDEKLLNRKIIHFKFLQQKGRELKNIATFSKQARGSMARFIVQSHPKCLEDLKLFNLDGYKFVSELSSADTLVFKRRQGELRNFLLRPKG